MKKHKVTDNEIQFLNCIREEYVGKFIKQKELNSLLKGVITDRPRLIGQMDRHNLFLRNEKREYAFKDTPIYKGTLQQCYDDAAKDRVKNKPPKKLKISQEEMIAALKSEGFRVLKPVVKLEKLLENPDSLAKELIEYIDL